MNPIVDIFRNLCSELLPLETSVSPKLEKLDDIKAVVFDVYGTLFVSGAGDLSTASRENRDRALSHVLKELCPGFDPGNRDLSQMYYDAITQSHIKTKHSGVVYPEVEIREIWTSIIKSFILTGDIADLPEQSDIELAATRYECLVNPVWPMPDLADVLTRLSSNFKLGIVSNAQFFTPLLFDAFVDKSLDELGFDKDACVWSYDLREAKPSEKPYQVMAYHMLTEHKIENSEILYIGNDMRNDIWPASSCGIKTALFAGDSRSLRLREDDSDCNGVIPDLVITDLKQLFDCI